MNRDAGPVPRLSLMNLWSRQLQAWCGIGHRFSNPNQSRFTGYGTAHPASDRGTQIMSFDVVSNCRVDTAADLFLAWPDARAQESAGVDYDDGCDALMYF